MIRPAKREDAIEIKELVRAFYQEGLNGYGLSWDSDTIDTLIMRVIETQISIVAEKDNEIIGLIAAIVSPSLLDSKQFIAQELFWYVIKSERKGSIATRLLSALEKECKKLEIKFLIMVGANQDYKQMEQLYKTHNYKFLEGHFIKGV